MCIFGLFDKNQVAVRMMAFIWFSILFRSMHLYLCQYHTVFISIVIFMVSLEISNAPPTVFFFFIVIETWLTYWKF